MGMYRFFGKCVQRGSCFIIVGLLVVIILLCLLLVIKVFELTVMTEAIVLIVNIITLIVSIVTLAVVVWGICEARNQLEHSNSIAFAQLSNGQNWKLYDEYDNLPSSHPIKKKYTENRHQMMWRVLHLNHLNLLEVAFKANNRNIIGDEEFRQWVDKYKELFRFVITDPPESDGRKTLEDIKQRNEEYSKDYRELLKNKELW